MQIDVSQTRRWHVSAWVKKGPIACGRGSCFPGVRLKDSGRYLDCARIGSCASVFFHYSPGVDLEFTLRPADVVDKQELGLS